MKRKMREGRERGGRGEHEEGKIRNREKKREINLGFCFWRALEMANRMASAWEKIPPPRVLA